MRAPKAIKAHCSINNRIYIKVVGLEDDEALPYLHVETSDGTTYGYIEDRDLKRLKRWCEECIKRKGKL